jgi:hypothetical protein
MQKIRKGRHVKTIITGEHSTSEFSEVDDLDTKTMKEAIDNYERVFITVRSVLENNEQFCCDDLSDRLSLAQLITDSIKQSLLICRG